MLKYYLSYELKDLVDINSNSVAGIAVKLGKKEEETFRLLSEAYEKAKTEKSIIVDSSGIRFETDFAMITMIQNTKPPLEYPLYLTYRYMSDEAVREENKSYGSILPDTLDEDVALVAKPLILLNKYLQGKESLPSDEVINKLKESYRIAKERGELIPFKDGYNFLTGMATPHGKMIRAGIKPSEYNQSMWILNYIGEDQLSNAIDRFAEMPYQRILPEVAMMARKEKWHFGETEENYEILKNYLIYTFCRLEREDKICISADKTFAAINTGLATSAYDDIYLCFKRDEMSDPERWKYAGVCTAGEQSLGKRLIECFAPLPQACAYITCKEDIVYDMAKLPYLDKEHIVIERVHRLPMQFLRGCAFDKKDILALLDRIEQASENCDELYEELKSAIKQDRQLYDRIGDSVENIVQKTIKRLRWNYRLAIPSYYPKRDTMSLLLPLDFTDCGKPQAALVVQLTESGNYNGPTILNMRYAYQNARLVSSQEESWLSA